MSYPEHWNEADIRQEETLSPVSDLVTADHAARLAGWASAAGIGLGVALIALGAADRGPGGLIWLGLLAAAAGLALLLFRHLALGVTLFLGVCWLSVGTPGIARGGSGADKGVFLSEVGLVGLLAVWGLCRLLRRDGPLCRTPLAAPMVVYLVVAAWSAAHNLLFPDPHVVASGARQFLLVNVVELALRCLALGATLLLGNALYGPWVARAIGVFVGSSVVSWLIGYTPLRGLSSQFMAFPQALTLGMLVGWLLTGQAPRALRLPLVAAAAGMFFWICVQNAQWVSGVCAALTALTIVIFSLNRRLFAALLLVAAALVALNWDYVRHKVYDENFYAGGQMNWGLQSLRGEEVGAFENDRTRMWRAAVRYAETFPLGVGPGNYRAYNSYYGRPDVWNTTTFTSAHGTYAQTLSETGWPGLIALLWLLGSVIRMQRRFWKATPDGPAKTTQLALLAGTVGVTLAGGMGDYLFPTYHNGGLANFGSCVYFWLAIGLSIALARQTGALSAALPAPKVRRPVAPLYQRAPFPGALPAPPEKPR